MVAIWENDLLFWKCTAVSSVQPKFFVWLKSIGQSVVQSQKILKKSQKYFHFFARHWRPCGIELCQSNLSLVYYLFEIWIFTEYFEPHTIFGDYVIIWSHLAKNFWVKFVSYQRKNEKCLIWGLNKLSIFNKK